MNGLKEVIDTKNMFDFVTRLNTTSESKVINVWRNVVSKIRTSHDDEDDEKRIPIGERLASNTRVINLKNGVLLVETDHSGWIQYLKVYQKFISGITCYTNFFWGAAATLKIEHKIAANF